MASCGAMDFDAVVAQVRGWCLQPVVVVLEPDHSVMPGVLHELDSAGIDGALFAVADPTARDARPTGIAIALFRDAFVSAEIADDGALHVRQGRIEIIVTRQDASAAPPPGR
jgi:hypothetical protein